MQAHLDDGLTFDYAMSNNGAVPAKYNDPGLAWTLVWCDCIILMLELTALQISKNVKIRNGNYTGKLPGWGTRKFLAA
jgi:hypothetical protein